MSEPERQALKARIEALIDRLADGGRDDDARDALLADLARYQAARVEVYGRLVAAREGVAQPGSSARTRSAQSEWPALPTDVFRHVRVASFGPEQDVRVFHSSGTTDEERSVHPFRDLSLYERAARAAARFALFPDRERMPLVVLAPDEREAPHSSLSFMLARFGAWFGEGAPCQVWRDDALDLGALTERLRAVERQGTPVALLGTSFAFVHALDGLADVRFRLPAGSRLMLTGGYKGRSREVSPDTLRAQLTACLGVPEPFMVDEYGMTELSSQAYSLNLREAVMGPEVGPRRLWAPGWLRVRLVDGDGLCAVKSGQNGLIRLDDSATLDGVSAVQTADIGTRQGDGFVVLGRAQGAGARGCSLSVDQALDGRSP